MPTITYETSVNGNTLSLYRRYNGILANATSATLADSTNTFGIMRLDNQAITVSSGTAVTNPLTGIYQYSLSSIDPRFSYVASFAVVNTFGTDYVAAVINQPGIITTRGQVRAAAARLMGLLVREGTTTSATSSTIVDSSTSNGGLVSNSDSPYLFDGCFLLMTSGPAAGLWRECSQGGYTATTGTINLAASFSTSPTSGGGDTYEIYSGLTPDQWSLRANNSIVDFGLQRCRYLRRGPITLVTDGDMEASGVSAWTASSASLVKTVAEPVSTGAQALLVINNSTNGYAQSSAISVIPGHGYIAAVDYRCVGSNLSTATLQVWDVTNNALIIAGTDQDSGINFEGGRSQTAFTVPTNCYKVAFRLVGTQSNAIIAWDDLVVYTAGRRRYVTPTWIQNRNQIMRYQAREGNRPYEDSWYDVGWPQDIQEDPTAYNAFIIDLPQLSSQRPLYVQGEGQYGPMSGLSDNLPVSIPLEWAAASCARAAWQMYSRDLEEATVQRAVIDRSIIEVTANQLDNIYMPRYSSSIGMTEGYTGTEVLRMP